MMRMTQIIVTPRWRFARDAADKIIVLDEGRSLKRTRPDVSFQSRDERTREFLRSFLS